MKKISSFDSCLYAVPQRIRVILEKLPSEVKENAQEIRLRNNLPLSLTVNGKPIFVSGTGQTSVFSTESFICNGNDTAECLRLLTKQSVFAHTGEIKNGFVRMDFGHRAGICGSFSESGMIGDIWGINIRIARQILGCADDLIQKIDGGTLVLGPPGSGKTTLIRDIVRLLSGSGKRVSVVDTRGEITALYYGMSPYDLGVNTDVYLTQNKGLGIEMALRTLFPNVVAFDEIGNNAELRAVLESFNAGIDVITSAHLGSYDEIGNREIVKKLVLSGAVKTVIMLSGEVGKNIKIYKGDEIKCML